MTTTISRLLIVAVLLCASAGAQEPSRADGTLVADAECSTRFASTYEQYAERRKTFYAQELEQAKKEGVRMTPIEDLTPYMMSRQDFDKRQAYVGFECRRITYLSDGLKVMGFIWKPKDTAGKKLPLIIYNRGGNRDDGKLFPWAWSGFYNLVSNGFVVIASQYRGNDGGEGKEEFGGADVRDVLNLFPLAKSLGYVDMNNVFMYGASRGGMMTFVAIREGAPINAAVVTAGLSDMIPEAKARPLLVSEVWVQLIPGFKERPDEVMRERSAVYWADRINVPLMLQHGGADWRVSANNALTLAQRLQEHKKTYELIVYAGDDHGLTLNGRDADRRAMEWFRKHMKQEAK